MVLEFVISFIKIYIWNLEVRLANSFYDYVIQITFRVMNFHDICSVYSQLWKIKIHFGNLFSLKSPVDFYISYWPGTNLQCMQRKDQRSLLKDSLCLPLCAHFSSSLSIFCAVLHGYSCVQLCLKIARSLLLHYVQSVVVHLVVYFLKNCLVYVYACCISSFAVRVDLWKFFFGSVGYCMYES